MVDIYQALLVSGVTQRKLCGCQLSDPASHSRSGSLTSALVHLPTVVVARRLAVPLSVWAWAQHSVDTQLARVLLFSFFFLCCALFSFLAHLLFERLHDGIAAAADVGRLFARRQHAGGEHIGLALGPEERIGVEFGSIIQRRLHRVGQSAAYCGA